MDESKKLPVFISYCRDNATHNEWVRRFADRLLLDGVDVVVDRLSLTAGESATQFMEKAIASADFVLMICTPEYKRRSDARQHGVGYEAELMAARQLRGERGRFIPVLREGDWLTSLPEWAAGTFGVDLRSDENGSEFAHLFRVLKHERPRGKPAEVPTGSIIGRILRRLRAKLSV